MRAIALLIIIGVFIILFFLAITFGVAMGILLASEAKGKKDVTKSECSD